MRHETRPGNFVARTRRARLMCQRAQLVYGILVPLFVPKQVFCGGIRGIYIPCKPLKPPFPILLLIRT